MKKLILAVAAAFLLTGASRAMDVDLKLWQLDCGTIHFDDVGSFDDTFSLNGQAADMSDSCYLIKHGGAYMIWDTGLPARFLKSNQKLAAAGAKKSSFTASYDEALTTQISRLGISSADISLIAVSHNHLDHIGQAALFPNAKLLIGAQDLAALKATPLPFGAEPALLAPWLSDGAKVEAVIGDKDIFGDGRIVMFATPGHTPGHHSLLVRLKNKGPILLTGDLYHLHAERESGGVPLYNASRADTLASMDRFDKMAKALHATTIIQHDPADKAKLAAYPDANN